MEYDPSQPLPDSDLVTSEDFEQLIADEINANADKARRETTPSSPVEKKHKRRWLFSDDYLVLTLVEPAEGGAEPEKAFFSLGQVTGLPQLHLAAFGASILLGRADDPVKEFERITSGEAAKRKEPKGKPVPVSFWRQAIALAYIDATKKAPSGQMTLEAATAKANGLDRTVMMRLKGDPAVIKHHNKLSGATTGYSVKSLLEAEEAAAA